MNRNIPDSVKHSLYMKSGRRCAKCNTDLLPKTNEGSESNISEIAHINAFGQKGPRADSDMDISEKNSADNLILLCSNCHKIIDKNPKIFTVQILCEMKSKHVENVLEKLNKDIPNISFSELEDILKYLASDQFKIEKEYTLLLPTEKIKRNNLSNQVAQSILSGVVGANEVGKYLDKHPDTQHGNRIKDRFVAEYKKLRNEKELTEDELFWALCDFASLHSSEREKIRAGLSVVVYLFEKCEVFEK